MKFVLVNGRRCDDENGKETYHNVKRTEPLVLFIKRIVSCMWENMRRRVLIAKYLLFEPYGACSLLVLT